MAKKSMIAKAKREPKFSTRHTTAAPAAVARASIRKFGLCRICCASCKANCPA